MYGIDILDRHAHVKLIKLMHVETDVLVQDFKLDKTSLSDKK